MRRTRGVNALTSPCGCISLHQRADRNIRVNVSRVIDAINAKAKELEELLPVAVKIRERFEIVGIDLLPNTRHFGLHSGIEL
jgi:hypothetical protein